MKKIKAFFNPEKNLYFIKFELLKKVFKLHKNFKMIQDKNFDEMFTIFNGMVIFWFLLPLKNDDGLTTSVIIFKSFKSYKFFIKSKIKIFKRKLKKIWKKCR